MAKKKPDLYLGIALVLIALFQLLGLFSMVGIALNDRFFYIIIAVTGAYLIFKGV